MQMPFLPFRLTSRTSPANSTLLPSSSLSSSIAVGAILALAVDLLSQISPGGGSTSTSKQHFDIQTVEKSLRR